MWVWVVVVGLLSLLPFFQFFKKGDPHQLAAIAELERSIDQDLLSDEAEWFETWKASGIHQEVYGVPYYNQLDSPTGYGYRECFDSAAAMVAAFHRVVKSQDAYRIRRRKHGDTTEVHAQVSTLQSFGLNAEFRKNVRVEDIEIEILPIEYMKKCIIKFKDGNVWEVDIKDSRKKQSIDDIEQSLETLYAS